MKKLLVCALCAAMVVPALSVSVSADSKELVLYTWENMFPQEVLDGFEEETGIKVVYSNFDTDENMLEKLSMAKGGDYDIVVADDYIIETAIQEGLVEKLDTSKLSGWDNINPLYQGQFYDPNDEYTAPYGAGIPLIVYDPDRTASDMALASTPSGSLGAEEDGRPATADTASSLPFSSTTILSAVRLPMPLILLNAAIFFSATARQKLSTGNPDRILKASLPPTPLTPNRASKSRFS